MTELGELTQLELLGVSDNQLTSFPECICRLRNLRRLQISRNKLRQLPAGVYLNHS
ncbi:MAG: hypothetical protein LGB68_06170 [Sulfurovum sp.]|nr:hypothetical protein [Sulfurovum sp.]MCB4778076.1 hypothetical protein [Sulfurovum sp.]